MQNPEKAVVGNNGGPFRWRARRQGGLSVSKPALDDYNGALFCVKSDESWRN